ncbi:hypothetical protein CRUP_014432 [Coryphaenoides rupestris]|nr:hypothetical protein CRUP_014432 [Coryphaenoides rupestris]
MINILWCDFDKSSTFRNQTYNESMIIPDICSYPEYFVFTGVLAMVTCAVFLRLNSVLKLAMLLVMIGVYCLLTEAFYTGLFLRYDTTHHNTQNFLGTKETSLLLMAMFLLAVFYHGQQLEYTARLDFLWRVQAKEEINEMKELREHNENMLRNILPSHVARHFLEKDRDNEELYSQSYDSVGVMFASIPGFADFYSQTEMNNQGVECLRLLNEIIADFDELLGEERFQDIEKIKTIGSTYMAVSGLSPEKQEINKHSFNNFELRIGMAHGSVVAGVIGAKKPQYDIWGKTVNLSSRMDSTGVSGKIQVPDDTFVILKERGFAFEYRGEVYVKGISEQEGKIRTHFLSGRVQPNPLVLQPRKVTGQYSLAAVVLGLVHGKMALGGLRSVTEVSLARKLTCHILLGSERRRGRRRESGPAPPPSPQPVTGTREAPLGQSERGTVAVSSSSNVERFLNGVLVNPRSSETPQTIEWNDTSRISKKKHHLKLTCLPAHLSTCPPVYLPTHPPVYLPTCLPAHPPTCLPAHLSTCPPPHLSTCPPVYLPTHPPVYLPTCLPAHLPTSPPVYLPTCLPAHSPTCLPAHPSTCLPAPPLTAGLPDGKNISQSDDKLPPLNVL